MTQKLLRDLKWIFFEKRLIGSEDIRYQKIVIDARVWYRDQCSPTAENNSNVEECISLKCVFQQLYRLVIEQIQILVVFPKTIKGSLQISDFFANCIALLQVMSIPYIQDDNVPGLIAQLIKKQVVDHSLTDDAEVLLQDIQSVFQYSHFKSVVHSKNQLFLAKYSKCSGASSNQLICFLSLSSSLLDANLQFSYSSEVQSGLPKENDRTSPATPTRPIINRACKKTWVQPVLVSKVGKAKVTSKGKSEERKMNKCQNKVAPNAGMDFAKVLTKLGEVILSWSDNPQDRLKLFQLAIDNQQIEQLTELEREFLLICCSSAGKTLSEIGTIVEANRPERDQTKATSEIAVVQWERAEFTRLRDYLQANCISIPLKHLLGYLVAFDFFQLFKSHISGDSYPDGIARPEKVLKVSKKNGPEIYDVKWLYIPGTEKLSQEDLITKEQKNIFCAAFPKVASKFEGWNLMSSSNDDDDDNNDTIRDEQNTLEELCPLNMSGSLKKCMRKKNRARRNSVETPASTTSSGTKSTVKQYFVARKKLIFDAIK